MKKCVAVIPARYASSRLPGKPLVSIHGKTMLQRVIEQTYNTPSISEVLVATDDERIFEHVRMLGHRVELTSPDITSGTLRCFQAIQQSEISFDILINVQGDEPFISPDTIESLSNLMTQSEVAIGTAWTSFEHVADIENPNNVKVVVDKNNRALYFSRSVIPYDRSQNGSVADYKRHVGLYAFKKEVISSLNAIEPSSLELREGLEQLCWLENGYSIGCVHIQDNGISVDTAEDLKLAIKYAEMHQL